jgi:hypothetical protein
VSVARAASGSYGGKGNSVCVACRARIPDPLAMLGSLRCAACRSGRRSPEEELVRRLVGSSGLRRLS